MEANGFTGTALEKHIIRRTMAPSHLLRAAFVHVGTKLSCLFGGGRAILAVLSGLFIRQFADDIPHGDAGYFAEGRTGKQHFNSLGEQIA